MSKSANMTNTSEIVTHRETTVACGLYSFSQYKAFVGISENEAMTYQNEAAKVAARMWHVKCVNNHKMCKQSN